LKLICISLNILQELKISIFLQVLIGGTFAALIQTWPSSSNSTGTVPLSAPPRPSPVMLPVELECTGQVGRVDLQVSVEYRNPASVDVRGGAPCIQYSPCRLYMTITSPPCPIHATGDAVLDIPGWASTIDATSTLEVLYFLPQQAGEVHIFKFEFDFS
jgi:hypothetical protein